MTRELLIEFKQDIESFTLIPSGGGKFEVVVDGDLIYSKLAEDRFPTNEEILEKLKK